MLAIGTPEKYQEQLYNCLRCGACRGDPVMEATYAYYAVCPIPLVKPGFDVYYPRGKMALGRAYVEGKVKPEEIADYFYMCTNCQACQIQYRNAHVPRTDKSKQPSTELLIDIPSVVEAFKAELASKGVRLASHERFAESVKEHNPYVESHGKRFA